MEFTCDWVSDRMPLWLPHVGHLQGTPCQLLEIGSFEGRSAVWMIANLMGNLHSTLCCIDPWDGGRLKVSGEHERRFDANIEATGAAGRVLKFKGRSHEVLRDIRWELDLAYIDGSHEARDSLEDAVLVWRKIKPGGFVIFDDYKLTSRRFEVQPRHGINAFLRLWASQLKVLHTGYQVIVRKS